MPDTTDAIYEVRVLIHVDRELTDDEQRTIGDAVDVTLSGRLRHGLEDEIVDRLAVTYGGEFTIESHGPDRVIA